ncbi:MAG: Serine phosphatase RsbU, regulator of sigma subunit [Acidimicrobiales bacterium]|nr:Serine phosphatase RsbU, regulator of sigma subunit [Acidimicrobiales bacterium]
MQRNGIGGPEEPWDDAAWQARVQSGVTDTRRVSAVEATGLLDAAPEDSFDQLARLAAAVLGVPWVFVTLVDEHRSFWVSAVGVEPDAGSGLYGENPVAESFCQYVIGADAAVVIDDARLDPRSDQNPSITSMGVVAWAGFPLRSTDGHVMGTFCAVDRVAREWSGEDITLLHALASAATSHLQLRAALAIAEESARELAEELERRDLLVSRATMLAQLARELSGVSTVDDVARVVTTTGREVLGAVFANIAVVDADHRHLDIVHSPSLPADIAGRYSRIVLSDDLPLAHAVTRGETILVPDLDTLQNHYPHILDDTRAAGLGSTVSIPLFRTDRSVAGAIGIGWSGPVEFTPIVRSVLTTVSEMCAQALDRSQVGDARTQFVRSLQYALLSSTGQRDGLDIAAEYIAANDTLGFGGDWYDFIHLSPTRTALVIGDICGHGIEAAARMTQVRGAINAFVSIHPDELGRLFGRAEQQLNLSDRDFVATVSVHVIDTETNTITYVSAGHPPALLVDGSGDALFLEGGRRPVLGMGGDEPETARADFMPGSILVAYTDGLVEQNRDLDDGLRRLSATVRSVRDRTARQISDTVSTTVGVNASDDVAYTVIRRV